MLHSREVGFNKQQAKRALLWAGLGFCLIQLTVDYAVDAYWPRIHSSYLAVMEDKVGQLQESPDVVVLGSSRLQTAIYDKELQARLREFTGDTSLRAFNACIPAQDLCTAEYVLGEMSKKEIKPSILVVEVTPEMVARRNRWLGAHVLPPLKSCTFFSYLCEIWRSENVARLVRERITPVYRYRQEIQRELGQVFYPIPQPGVESAQQPAAALNPVSPVATPTAFAAPPNSVLASSAAGQIVASDASKEAEERRKLGVDRFAAWLQDYEIGGTSALALERMLSSCHKRGITVLLVFPPLSSHHRRIYEPAVNQAFLTYMHQMEAAYGCSFHDCRASLPDNLFFDHHHVEWAGTMVFSRLLAKEILTPRISTTVNR